MWLFTVLAGLASIPTLVLFIEIFAAMRAAPSSAADDQLSDGRVVVVVPAHNESRAIIPTLQDICSQLRQSDRLIVVADNCNDDTAAVAVANGAQVIMRNEPDRRGKGYAMAWAIAYLREDPPDFVLFVDADCRLQSDFLTKILNHCGQTGRPTQALYLMTSVEGSPANQRVAEFAWRLKNWVRPLGLTRLGRPVQLMGTGMMFPWHVIRSAPLASGNIVEDLKLGLDLAIAGSPACFLPSARVTSEFAATERGAETQRQRWIQGHLAMIVDYVPRLFVAAIVNRNFDLVVLALDLLVPPLSLFVTVAVGLLVVFASYAWLFEAPMPLAISSLNLGLLVISLSVAWARFGRDILTGKQILAAASEIPRRLSLFRRLAQKSGSGWVRTDRQKSE